MNVQLNVHIPVTSKKKPHKKRNTININTSIKERQYINLDKVLDISRPHNLKLHSAVPVTVNTLSTYLY